MAHDQREPATHRVIRIPETVLVGVAQLAYFAKAFALEFGASPGNWEFVTYVVGVVASLALALRAGWRLWRRPQAWPDEGAYLVISALVIFLLFYAPVR